MGVSFRLSFSPVCVSILFRGPVGVPNPTTIQYQGDVLEAVFGSAETLAGEASQDIFVALVALPGYFVAVALVAKMGPRRVQVGIFYVGCFSSFVSRKTNEKAWLPSLRCGVRQPESSTAFASVRSRVTCDRALLRKQVRHAVPLPLVFVSQASSILPRGCLRKRALCSHDALRTAPWSWTFLNRARRRRTAVTSRQVQGFLAMAVLFAVIGLSFRHLRRHAGMLMLLYRWGNKITCLACCGVVVARLRFRSTSTGMQHQRWYNMQCVFPVEPISCLCLGARHYDAAGLSIDPLPSK